MDEMHGEVPFRAAFAPICFIPHPHTKGTPMNFSIARQWFARLVMAYALAINTFLAWLYIVEPQKHIKVFGVSISGSPESLNFLRAGPGAMFTTLALAALCGLLRPSRFLNCLSCIVLLSGCIVAARIYGMAVDGLTPLQLTELRDEGISWLFFVAALIACPRSHFQRPPSASSAAPTANRLRPPAAD